MQSRKAAAALAVVGLAAAIVLFIVLRDDSGSEGNTTRVLSFRLADGDVVGGAQDVSVNQGDGVDVSLRTDVPAELHVHGYDVHTDAKAGQQAKLEFTADATGEFEVEAHRLVGGEEAGAGIELAQLRVNP